MSRVWLAIGMFLSLLVSGGYLAYAATHPTEESPPSVTSVSTPASSPTTGTAIQDSAARKAERTVTKALAALRRLNRAKHWTTSDSAETLMTELNLIAAARSLNSQPLLRRVALRANDFSVALRKLGEHPTQAHYKRYNETRKALNKAIGATQ